MTKPDAEKLVDDFEDAAIDLACATSPSEAKQAGTEYERIRDELIRLLVTP